MARAHAVTDSYARVARSQSEQGVALRPRPCDACVAPFAGYAVPMALRASFTRHPL